MAKAKKRKIKPSRKPPSKPEQTAITVKPAPERPWQLSSEEVTIVKNSIAKGASDKELEYCLTVARRYRLDPFKQQIWFISRWDKNADNGHNGTGAYVWTPQVGINGLLFAAARDHRPDFGSISKPVYGPIADGHPEWARVTVTKKDGSSTEGEAYWDEYAPADLSKAPFWRKMPRRMLSKCATALAVREAYPDLGGLYIPEEMERMNEDFTKSGRQIEADVPIHGSHAASQAILAEKLAGERPLVSDPIPIATAPPAPAAKPAIVGCITIDYTDSETHPQIQGDIQQLYDALVQGADMKWDSNVSFNRVPQGKVEFVRQMCEMKHYHLKEIFPNRRHPDSGKGGAGVSGHASPNAERGNVPGNRTASVTQSSPNVSPVPPGHETGSRAMTDRRPANRTQGSTGATPEPVAVKGIIERVNHVMLNGGKRVAYVTLLVDKRKIEFSSWDKSINDHLEKGKGKEAVILAVTKGKYRNLVGVKAIGSTLFDEDGKTPIIQNSQRETGTKTLW